MNSFFSTLVPMCSVSACLLYKFNSDLIVLPRYHRYLLFCTKPELHLKYKTYSLFIDFPA